jgi:hypothetical protein
MSPATAFGRILVSTRSHILHATSVTMFTQHLLRNGVNKTEENYINDSLVYEELTVLYSSFGTEGLQWSEFLATDPEIPGSIPDPTRFCEK